MNEDGSGTCGRASKLSRVRMTWNARLSLLALAITPLATSCNKVVTDPSVVASVELLPIASPSVVVGDSLRDTLGLPAPVRAIAYNIQGDPLSDIPIRYRLLDNTSAMVIDSVTGHVTGISVTAPLRVIADARGLQTQPRTIAVVREPEQIAGLNIVDSVLYRFTDSELISPALQSQLWAGTDADSTGISDYLVSYRIVYPSGTTYDSLGELTTSSGQRSHVDTTDQSGVAARHIKVRLLHLQEPVDSVVVEASVRYRGLALPGSPVRFILHIKPQ